VRNGNAEASIDATELITTLSVILLSNIEPYGLVLRIVTSNRMSEQGDDHAVSMHL
jgi:hypothetical protein